MHPLEGAEPFVTHTTHYAVKKSRQIESYALPGVRNGQRTLNRGRTGTPHAS